MATTTTNLGLIEPAGTDHALVANINTNSEKIDAEAGKARANFALVQNGDTATQAISQGQLVNWKGALKKATTNIASGATLSSSNLTDDSIASEIASLNGNIKGQSDFYFTTGTGFSVLSQVRYKLGSICVISARFKATQAFNTDTVILTVPTGYKPIVETHSLKTIHKRGTSEYGYVGHTKIKTNGELVQSLTSNGLVDDEIEVLFIYNTI